jgi:hypothetical protein
VWGNPDYFRSKSEILSLDENTQYLVGDCRGLPQAVDLKKVHDSKSELLFLEIYHTIGSKLVKSTFLKNVTVTTVFLSPIGKQEIEDLRMSGVDLAQYLAQIMLHKLLVRRRYQGKTVDKEFVKDAIERAGDTISELKSACKYSHIIVNHDGEGNPNWHILPNGVFTQIPEADAGRSVNALLCILCKSVTENVENWVSLPL